MLNNDFPLTTGGFHAFTLPAARECASIARSALTIVMSQLDLPQPLIDDGALAVSELASNSLLHAPSCPYELWIWRHTVPEPELVVSVFDTDRTRLPTFTPGDLLAENG
ncbi:ATP-binding protein [Actinomadura kijaniata]|uniref:ATP-binding protein n=1 Tax=Actinomadura kijaniata TaxID=46161 RepID=UPI003F1C6AB6